MDPISYSILSDGDKFEHINHHLMAGILLCHILSSKKEDLIFILGNRPFRDCGRCLQILGGCHVEGKASLSCDYTPLTPQPTPSVEAPPVRGWSCVLPASASHLEWTGGGDSQEGPMSSLEP